MKLLFDFLPIFLFFGAYTYADGHKEWAAAFATTQFGFLVSGGQVGQTEAPVLLATVVVVVATMLQVAWLKLKGKKVDVMLWVNLVVVTVLGGLTVYFHNDNFIKWKPSVLYWFMGLAFWLGPLMFNKNLLRMFMGEQMQLPERVWHRLNFAWVAFFAMMGLLNLYVAYTFSQPTWVKFKVFGGLGLMLVFTIAQGLYLGKYMEVPAADTDASKKADAP